MSETMLYQLELDQREVNCGMSYVVKLCDGRFILIDGGYFSEGEDDRLYEFLRQHADSEIVVAGWFFSHAHQDHVGAFLNFTKKYRNCVKVEKLYYNFQPVDTSAASDDWKSCDAATVKEFYRVIQAYYPAESVHILHTGEKIELGEATFEVLYTQENLYPTVSSFNDYSSVLLMEVGGQKTLWLGDLYQCGCAYLLANKKDKLPCDLVQIAHHGYNGATIELYEALGARVALWPTPDYRMDEISVSPVNSYLLQKSGIEEHLISGYGTAELVLPYVPHTAKRFEKLTF